MSAATFLLVNMRIKSIRLFQASGVENVILEKNNFKKSIWEGEILKKKKKNALNWKNKRNKVWKENYDNYVWKYDKKAKVPTKSFFFIHKFGKVSFLDRFFFFLSLISKTPSSIATTM